MADVQSLHQKASNALIDEKFDVAENLYLQIIEIAPYDEVAHQQLMEIYENTNREKYYLSRANFNIVQQKLEHAINDCKKAINENQDSLVAYIKLARLYASTAKNLKAIDTYTRILDLDEKNIQAYKELAELYVIEGTEESAVNVLKQALKFAEGKDVEEINNGLARVYYKLSDYENALNVVLDKNLKIKILIEAEKLVEAEELIKSINENHLKNDALAEYLVLSAQFYYTKKELDRALELVQKYTEIKGNDPVSYQMKALIYDEKGDNFLSSYNWGYCRKAQGKLEEAIIEFNDAHGENPKDKNTIIELANLYLQTGDKYTSIDFWQKDYELDGNDYAKDKLANFYYEQGDYTMAARYGKVKEKPQNASQKEYVDAPTEDEGLLDKIISFFVKK